MSETLVKEYYTTQVRKEWRRLVRDAYHRLEYMTTLHFLEKYLPPNGLILDAVGGPGRYTFELARPGYQVVLLDMTPANLEFASRQLKRAGLPKEAVSLVEGSIVDLSQFADDTFDAVLCLGGPLSHILDAGKRDKATRRTYRRWGGPLSRSRATWRQDEEGASAREAKTAATTPDGRARKIPLSRAGNAP